MSRVPPIKLTKGQVALLVTKLRGALNIERIYHDSNKDSPDNLGRVYRFLLFTLFDMVRLPNRMREADVVCEITKKEGNGTV